MAANIRSIYWSLCTLCILHTTAWPTFCSVRSSFDQMVYVTDKANKSITGLTRTQCSVECAFFAVRNAVGTTCRCFSYDSVSMNCSIFNYEPKTYVIATSNETITYQVSNYTFRNNTACEENKIIAWVCFSKPINMLHVRNRCILPTWGATSPAWRPAICSGHW